jgi:hypothetical protein
MTNELAVKELGCAAEDLHEARLILGRFTLVNEMSTAAEHVRNGMDHVENTIRTLTGTFRDPNQLSFVILMRRHLAVHRQKLIDAGIGENVELLDAMLADMEPFLLKVVTTELEPKIQVAGLGPVVQVLPDGDRWNLYGKDPSAGPVTDGHHNTDFTGYSTRAGAEEALREIEEGPVDPGEKLGYTDPDPEREGQDRYIKENSDGED